MRSRLRAAGGLVTIATAYGAIMLWPAGSAPPDALMTVVAAIALAAAVVMVAERMSADRRVQLGAWFALVYLNLAAVAVEGTLFAPGLAPPQALGGNLLRLLAAAGAVAGLAAALYGRNDGVFHGPASRPWTSWAWRLLAATAVYCVLYFVIGGVNYTLVTRPYYEAHAGSLTVPAAQTVLLYEPVRGFLIAVSVLPLVLALRLRKAAVAAIAGLLLFVVGGLVPLLPQTSLPLYLRVASLWEIFGQNFLTGIACAYLFAGSTQRAVRRATQASAP